MRRALVIAGVMLAGLLALAPALATAAETPIPTVKFELHEGGFLVTLKSEVGEEKVVLTLSRHGEIAYYETPAELTADTVKARFGTLGELDYAFTPGRVHLACPSFAEGTFEGTFDFTGENDYVTFEADRATGSVLGQGPSGCKAGRPRPAAFRRARVEPKSEADAHEASLLVHTPLPLPARSMIVLEGEERHRQIAFFTAFEQEKREGMLIARGASAVGSRDDFTRNLKAGTASVHPPAPFTGSATFRRRPGGPSIWSGSLQAPILGGTPIRLAGPEFRSQLIKGSPLD